MDINTLYGKWVSRLDQAFRLLGIQDRSQRERMVMQVLSYVFSVVMAELSRKYLSQKSKHALSGLLKYNYQTASEKEIKKHWQAVLNVVNKEIELRDEVKQEILAVVSRELNKYFLSITENATSQQKKELDDIFRAELELDAGLEE